MSEEAVEEAREARLREALAALVDFPQRGTRRGLLPLDAQRYGRAYRAAKAVLADKSRVPVEAREARLREALVRWACHDYPCEYPDAPCACPESLSAVLAETEDTAAWLAAHDEQVRAETRRQGFLPPEEVLRRHRAQWLADPATRDRLVDWLVNNSVEPHPFMHAEDILAVLRGLL